MSLAKKAYDLIVIGGGSGGLGCARRAAGRYGKEVLIIEAKALGGTCVNVGCVPKKVMWAAANMREALGYAKEYGFESVDADKAQEFNWAGFKAKRDAYVERLNGIYARNLAKDSIDRVDGWATFVDAHTVKVGDDQYTGEHVLIATGGRPTIPKIEGAELGISSDGFFELEALPKRVAVVGAGYIAVELAGILHTLGAETSLHIRHSAFLRTFDQEVIALLDEEMSKTGVSVERHSNAKKIVKLDDGSLEYTYEQNGETKTSVVDCVLFAIGREPATDGINIESTGVKLDARNRIIVDAMQNTSTGKVYALGDVCGKAELTPVAIAAGRKLSDRLFSGVAPYSRLDYENIPTAIFSHPPIGTCGMSEDEAIKVYGKEAIKVYRSKFTNMYHAMTEHKSPTFMKIVTVLPEEKVVGMHMLGIAADEMAQWLGVATKLGLTKAQLDSVIAVHPSAAEEFVTMT